MGEGRRRVRGRGAGMRKKDEEEEKRKKEGRESRRPLTDGTTLVSEDGTFELGFFSPGSSTNRFLGIWFQNITPKTVVWVANRDHPINNNTTKFTITKEGNLVLHTQNGTVHWSTNATTKAIDTNVVAQLLDTGNLVVRYEKDNDSQNYLWQSFDHPSDTLLPGMKLGWEVTKDVNLKRYLTAWNNWEDPSSGHVTYGFSQSNIPETQILNGSSILYESGPYNGIRLSAVPSLRHHPLFFYDYECDMADSDECYFQFHPRNKSLISRDDCDNFNRCGSFGICRVTGDSSSSTCECLTGFEPKSPENWVAGNWSEGCVPRSKKWGCREKNKDDFVVLRNVKVPYSSTCWINRSMTLEECWGKCWDNCLCTAYANSVIIGKGSGCILWFGDLLDMRHLPDSGQDLYVRLDISQMANQDAKAKGNSTKMVIMVTAIFSSVVIAIGILAFIYRRRKAKVVIWFLNMQLMEYSLSNLTFIALAWRLWKECIPMEFIDSCLGDSCILSEAIRCIHIGLLCVQHQPDDRPNMTSIMAMLTSKSALPQPKEPLFLIEKCIVEEDFGKMMFYSNNEVTISKVGPR
ncbi:hypothetical protein Fmac_021279 [Flemingia macrophylla]|uniref:non-specific serine/threonine protein kinase n=1 Tax=Flemingia macrophylla TaxID=520843 RepID=A0ABD1LWE0_9FABA